MDINKIVKNIKGVNDIDLTIINKKLVEIEKNRKNSILHFENCLKNCLSFNNKEALLLEFRRCIEMILRSDFILCAENVYDGKLFAVKEIDFLYFLNKKYYSDFKLKSFMDIFKLETNNYNKINPFYNIDYYPHLGFVLKYVKENYNGTYRFFYNRNKEYHFIYCFLFDYNKEISDVIKVLNSYHYVTDDETLDLYSTDKIVVKEKIQEVLIGFIETKNKVYKEEDI